MSSRVNSWPAVRSATLGLQGAEVKFKPKAKDPIKSGTSGQAGARVLFCSRNPSLRSLLFPLLMAERFAVEEPGPDEDPQRIMRLRSFDLILLDLKYLGPDACRQIRELSPRSGIIGIAAQGSAEDKTRILEAGADGYVAEPFEPREFLASMRAVLRRVPGSEAVKTQLKIGEFEIDLERRQFRRSGRPVHLTRKEFNLLAFMMQRTGVPLTHERLLRAIWGPEYGNELEYLRAYVWMIRKKIESNPNRPEYLRTETGIGYRFCDPQHSGVVEE